MTSKTKIYLKARTGAIDSLAV